MDKFYLKKRGINNHETLPFAKLTVSEIFVPLHWFHVFEMPNLLLGVLKKKYTWGILIIFHRESSVQCPSIKQYSVE